MCEKLRGGGKEFICVLSYKKGLNIVGILHKCHWFGLTSDNNQLRPVIIKWQFFIKKNG